MHTAIATLKHTLTHSHSTNMIQMHSKQIFCAHYFVVCSYVSHGVLLLLMLLLSFFCLGCFQVWCFTFIIFHVTHDFDKSVCAKCLCLSIPLFLSTMICILEISWPIILFRRDLFCDTFAAILIDHRNKFRQMSAEKCWIKDCWKVIGL